jgi:hypothetical protein
MKRQAHLMLIQRWGGVPATGRVLKTDLFEEAMGPDAFLVGLFHNGATVIGMDVSAAIASQAQRQDADRQGHYLVADTRRLPFASSTFALIISMAIEWVDVIQPGPGGKVKAVISRCRK